MYENFGFLAMKMDSLAQKNDHAEYLFLSLGCTRLVS